MDDDEQEKQQYAAQLCSDLLECFDDKSWKLAVVLLADPKRGTVAIHTVNATNDQAAKVLMFAASPYFNNETSDRTLN